MGNLQILFATIATESESIKILYGLVNLNKRPGGSQWQCRFKLSTGAWYCLPIYAAP